MTRPHSGWYVGRVLGIRFYLDYSWFIIAAALTFMLATSFFPTQMPGRSGQVYLALGVVAAALFFASIVLHELGHSVVSQRCGIPVPRITLLFIGGIAEISREPDSPKTELKVALAGPAVTALLIGLFVVLAKTFAARGFVAAGVLCDLLAMVNLQLIVFNMIPGYPLDGGRVLRALLWARSGNARRATYISSRIGVGFSWVVIALGMFLLLRGQFNGTMLLVVGIFLKGAAESGYLQTLYHEVLAGVRVADIMTPAPICIPAHTPLNLAVDDYFLAKHHAGFPVCDDDGSFRGLLRLEHLKAVPREKWPYTTAGQLAAENHSANATALATDPAAKTLRRLLSPEQSRLAVVEGDRVVGLVTRHDALQFVKIRSELEE